MASSGVPLFQELAGSPQGQITRGSHTATRKFLVSWEDLSNFLKELARGGTSGRPMTCPGMTDCYVSSMDFQPFTEDLFPDPLAITDPSTGINQYIRAGKGGRQYGAVVTVTYETDYYANSWPSSIPRPTVGNRHALRLSIRTSGQFLTYPSRTGSWDGTAYPSGSSSYFSSSNEQGQDVQIAGGGDLSKMPPDHGNRILLLIQDIRVEWYYVEDIDTSALDTYLGCVNSTAILGGAPGTVLFEGYDLDEGILLDVDNAHCFKITLNFRKRVKRLSGIHKWVTWNHDYRDPDPSGDGGWCLVTMADGRLRYELVNLNAIFSLGS